MNIEEEHWTATYVTTGTHEEVGRTHVDGFREDACRRRNIGRERALNLEWKRRDLS